MENYPEKSMYYLHDYVEEFEKMYPELYRMIMPVVEAIIDSLDETELNNLNEEIINRMSEEVCRNCGINTNPPAGHSAATAQDAAKAVILQNINYRRHRPPFFPYPFFPPFYFYPFYRYPTHYPNRYDRNKRDWYK